MSNLLPTTKVKATRINPKIIIVYSMPKVGKTTALADLENCLILDTEGGSEMYDVMRWETKTMGQFGQAYLEIRQNLDDQVAALKEEGVPEGEVMNKLMKPYRFIAIDTLDKFEDLCEESATRKYLGSSIGKTFEGNSVLELPKGAGYLHLRNEMIEKINLIAGVCETLILSCHVKDKIIDKGGVEVTATDLSLAGKLAQIVCSMADVIVYLYREPNKPMMANIGTDKTSAMGARAFPHLKPLLGKTFPFSWDKLFAPVAAEAVTVNP